MPMPTEHEPTMEPAPAQQADNVASPTKTKSFDEEMLSPVSKLELARKYAAIEQQKRVSQACDRMVEVKKVQITKKVEIEARLETHIRKKTSHQSTNEQENRGGKLSSIAMRLVDAFKATTDENDAIAANKQLDDDDSHSPTRQLLRATRSKLTALASKNEPENVTGVPATNYHLKQMGLVNEKVNIYAPIEEQQKGLLRRRESAIRCQEKYMQEHAEYNAPEDGYKSAEDSDYQPDADNEQDSESDDESEDEIDEDEIRRLVQDQAEYEHHIATLKLQQQETRKAKKAAKAKKNSATSIVVPILVVLLAVALMVFISEQQSGFCRKLVAQVPAAEEGRLLACEAVLHIQQFFARIVELFTISS